MSKIYEALRKAEQDRESARPRSTPQPGRPTDRDGRADNNVINSVILEEYQKLRASLVTVAVPSGLHTILVTAPRHGDGATTVALGLATALAKERESRVLLVEANVRTPCLSSLLPLPATTGLVDFAAGRVALDALPMRLEESNLSVVAAGEGAGVAADVELIDGLLSRLHAQYDFIVIDAAPVNSYADTSVLSTKVDGVILVIEADQTPVSDAAAAKRQLEKVGARILGVVLNRRRSYLPAFLERLL